MPDRLQPRPVLHKPRHYTTLQDARDALIAAKSHVKATTSALNKTAGYLVYLASHLAESGGWVSHRQVTNALHAYCDAHAGRELADRLFTATALRFAEAEPSDEEGA